MYGLQYERLRLDGCLAPRFSAAGGGDRCPTTPTVGSVSFFLQTATFSRLYNKAFSNKFVTC